MDGNDSIKDLIFEFFVHFATFEYTLKNNGWHKKKKYRMYAAEPDWEQYISGLKIANKLPESLGGIEVEMVKKECKFLLEFPPKKQAIRNEFLGYQSVKLDLNPDVLNWKDISILVRRIRNNLLHGEKEPFHRERDVKLIQAALEVMDYLASKDDEFNRVYFERVRWYGYE